MLKMLMNYDKSFSKMIYRNLLFCFLITDRFLLYKPYTDVYLDYFLRKKCRKKNIDINFFLR